MPGPTPPSPATLPERVVEVPRTELPAAPGGPMGPPVQSQVEQPNKGKQRSEWRAEEFRRVIGQHGKYVIWRKAMLCPCHDEDTGRARINCTYCDGSGYNYVDPIAIQSHMAQFEKTTKIFEKFGMWMEGKCSVTVFPEHRLGFRDSLEMRDSVMNFTEILTKGDRKGIRSVLPTGHDSARYRIVSVTRLSAWSGTAPVYLECGPHFTVSDDGWIAWTALGDSVVTAGTRISVRYEFHPVWIINSFPHSTRDDTTGRKSPKGVDRIVSHPLNAAAYLDFILDVNLPKDTVAPVTGGV